MQTIYTIEEMRAVTRAWRRAGVKTAFVPTMGNLHAGHISLLEHARQLADRTVVSIFVNPIQFGKGEDYARYPSTLAADQEKLESNGLDMLFAPDLETLYPGGTEQDTRLSVPTLSQILCGKFRPGHFSGVATVVCKLFINVQPDIALFGEKDYQQVLVIKRMVRDLLIPVEIVGLPIIREADGLAMSSRNAYLSAPERKIAPMIYATLCAAVEQLNSGALRPTTIEEYGMGTLSGAGFNPEYFSVRRAHDLALPTRGDRDLRILAAAWLGSARLIDNVPATLARPLENG